MVLSARNSREKTLPSPGANTYPEGIHGLERRLAALPGRMKKMEHDYGNKGAEVGERMLVNIND